MDCLNKFIDVCHSNGWRQHGNTATLTLSGGRSQDIYLEAFIFDGEDMARIFTRVGPIAELSEIQLNAVLGLNFSLPYGALACSGDDLVMADTFLQREMDTDHLAFSMNFLAATADRYEQQIYGKDEH